MRLQGTGNIEDASPNLLIFRLSCGRPIVNRLEDGAILKAVHYSCETGHRRSMARRSSQAMINILFVSHSPVARGGAERCLLTLMANLDRKRFTPVLACGAMGDIVQKAGDLSVKCEVIDLPWWLAVSGIEDDLAPTLTSSLSSDWSSPHPIPFREKCMADSWTRIRRICEIISENSIQIVHTNTITIQEAALAAKISGVKHVWHVHEFIEGHPTLRRILPMSSTQHLMNNFADVLVVPSQAMRDFYEGYACRARIQHIPNGVPIEASGVIADLETEDIRNKVRTEFRIHPGNFMITCVSNCGVEKGWADIVKVVRLLAEKRRDFKVIVVGHYDPLHPYFGEVVASAKTLQLAGLIEFAGYRTDAHSIIASSDLVLHPSKMESFGLVAAEAMGLEVPVVGTRCGGLEEVVSHGESGILCEVGDCREMATALDFLMEHPRERATFCRRGKELYLAKFQPKRYADRFMRLYTDLVSDFRPSGEDEKEKRLVELKPIIDMCLGIIGLTAYCRDLQKQVQLHKLGLIAGGTKRLLVLLQRAMRRYRRFAERLKGGCNTSKQL